MQDEKVEVIVEVNVRFEFQSVERRMSFWYLQFSHKMDKKKSSLLLWYLKSNCFRSFFGRIEDTKKTF